ncbi:MAG: hypothetical protein ACYDA2_11445, partial [Acidimicrobiales bacterium]
MPRTPFRPLLPLGAVLALGLAVPVVGAGAAAGAPQPIALSVPALLPPFPALPDPPQLGSLPGASSVPDLSTVPGSGGLPGGGEVPGFTNSAAAPVSDPSVGGVFGPLFAPAGPVCPHETQGAPDPNNTQADITCHPASVSMTLLDDGSVLYFDGLEGEENVQYSAAAEFGDKARNDQSRVLLHPTGTPEFLTPGNPTGGVTGNTAENRYLVPNTPGPLSAVLNDTNPAGSGALFCSDLVQLFNGEILTPGGSDYYSEPKLP